MLFLRQSTAVDLALGPFLDSTDGITAETALTIAQADVRLKKNNGAWAQVTDATSATHEENGWYEKEFDATDTNTVGILLVAVHEAGALPVWHEFTVLEEAVYDALFAASAAGFGTAQTGDSFARIGATGSGLTSLATPTNITAGTITTVTNLTNAPTAGDLTATMKTSVTTAATTATPAIATGGITAATFAAGAITAAALAADAGSEIADAVWDEALAGHAGAGSAGEALSAAGTAGDPWTTPLPGPYGVGTAGAILSGTVDTDGKIDTLGFDLAEVAAATSDVQDRIPAALVGGRMDASVGAITTAAAVAIWAALTSALTTVGSIGALLVEKVTQLTFTTPNVVDSTGSGGASAAAIADAVWDELTAGHVIVGSTGEAVAAGGGGGGLTGPQAAQLTAIEGKVLPLPTDPADQSVIMGAIAAIAGAPSAADNATAVWAKVIEQQGSITAQQALSIGLAILTGVTENTGLTIKTPNGVSIRVVGTVNALNERQTITLTPSAP